MWWASAKEAQSFAGESQRRALAVLARAQPCLVTRDVVARHRDYALALGELELAHHHSLLAERHFRGGEIELPHPYETGIVEALNFFAMSEETRAPVLERLGVVQAQDLDIGDQKARLLHCGQHLGQGRNIAAGEDVFGDPRVGNV